VVYVLPPSTTHSGSTPTAVRQGGGVRSGASATLDVDIASRTIRSRSSSFPDGKTKSGSSTASAQILTSFGDGGKMPGQFYAVTASHRPKATAHDETYDGRRLQRFLYKACRA